MQDVSLSIIEIYFYFCALEGSICVNGFHCSKSCDMASAQPNDRLYPARSWQGRGWGRKCLATFFPAPNAQPDLCLRTNPAVGLQIQPCIEFVEEFGS